MSSCQGDHGIGERGRQGNKTVNKGNGNNGKKGHTCLVGCRVGCRVGYKYTQPQPNTMPIIGGRTIGEQCQEIGYMRQKDKSGMARKKDTQAKTKRRKDVPVLWAVEWAVR